VDRCSDGSLTVIDRTFSDRDLNRHLRSHRRPSFSSRASRIGRWAGTSSRSKPRQVDIGAPACQDDRSCSSRRVGNIAVQSWRDNFGLLSCSSSGSCSSLFSVGWRIERLERYGRGTGDHTGVSHFYLSDVRLDDMMCLSCLGKAGSVRHQGRWSP
jgi:hypothetical protein